MDKPSLFKLDNDIWDRSAEIFFQDYPLALNESFWTNQKLRVGESWREAFVTKITGPYDLPHIYMLHDSQFDEEEIYEIFKVYAAYKVGKYTLSIILDQFSEKSDQIYYIRLEVIRTECDRWGGPELIPLSSAAKWDKRRDCKRFS